MKLTPLVIFIFLAAILCGGVAARGEDAKALVVDPQPGVRPKLHLTVPAGWTGKVIPADKPGTGLLVELTTPATGKPAGKLKMAFIWEEGGQMDDAESLSGMLEMGTREFAGGKKAPQLKLAGKSGHGLYCVFLAADQDPAPPPGAPKCMAIGMFSAGGWMIDFQLMTNDPKGPEFQQALKFLREGIAVDAAK